MLDRDEIEEKLKGVDHQLIVAFAARCSLRVFPLLVADKGEDDFWYWAGEKRASCVLELFVAQRFNTNFLIFSNKHTPTARVDTALFTAESAIRSTIFEGVTGKSDISSAKTVISSVNAIGNALNKKYITTKAIKAIAETTSLRMWLGRPTRTAVNTAIYATQAYANVEEEIYRDLEIINNRKNSFFKGKKSKAIFAVDFFYSPLWQHSPPQDWQLLCTKFYNALIGLDEGFELWVDWYKDRLEGVPLDLEQEEKGLTIPVEIREQGAKASNTYLANLLADPEEKRLKPLNLVRAIFIGHGAAGKTSLIRKLHGEPVVEGEEKMTAGIEIREWPVPKTDIKARFWDFGGQVMSHSTHQFFLRERCLYILVVDAGSERDVRENQTANEQAEYWLEFIKAFGNNALVMMVGNKSDKDPVNLDMEALTERYKNIIGFFPLSCTSDEEEFLLDFTKFQTVLIKQLQAVGTHQVEFTPNQFKVLDQVRTLSRTDAFLDHNKFDELYKDCKTEKNSFDQQTFVNLLNALGEIVHFPDLEWADAYVLNPRWLTYGVYTLLYSEEIKIQHGLLSRADVIRILQKEVVVDEWGNKLTYRPNTKCSFIIDAMIQFKLCYGLQQKEGVYVIPDKLPKKQPILDDYFDKQQQGTLAFEFDFSGFLPRSIMPNLIVSRHKEIVKDKHEKQLVWKHGVILYNKEYDATARWTVNYSQRCLRLWVQGSEPRGYLVILRDKINEVLQSIEGLSVNESVVLPEFARINHELFGLNHKEGEKAPYQRLLAEAKRGQKITSSDAGNEYDLQKIMGFIMTDKQQEKAGVNVTYNIENAGAVGGVGDNHTVTGTINLNSDQKKDVADLQESLTTLMKNVQDVDADFEIKSDAYAELKQIREHLGSLEQATPETKSYLTRLKDGSLSAFKLLKTAKDSEPVIAWVTKKATLLLGLF